MHEAWDTFCDAVEGDDGFIDHDDEVEGDDGGAE